MACQGRGGCVSWGPDPIIFWIIIVIILMVIGTLLILREVIRFYEKQDQENERLRKQDLRKAIYIKS